MAVKNNSGQNNSGRMISEAIRKIALGRSIERIDMAPSGMSGIGTARMIHGYVAKIHNDEGDEEFETYGGTIDVGEFPDETASSEPIIHKGVLLSGTKENNGGFLIIPTLFSDVTIVSDAATNYMYVLNFSHADIIYINSHNEVKIGVTETEELDSESNDSPDYDELEKTGNDFGVEIPEEINTDLRDIVLTEEMLAKGNRLMDMNLPKGMLVMLIKRGNEFMIPNGSLQLHAGDKLLIISESKTK